MSMGSLRLRASITSRTVLLAVLGCLLYFSVPAAAQNFTNVTGTITDPNGLPYSFANINATLVGVNPLPTINGQRIQGAYGAQADVNGTFSMTLASNAVVGGQWNFAVSIAGVAPPQGTGPQQFTATISISGASQSISATLNALAPALSHGGGSGSGCGTLPTSPNGVPQNCTSTPSGGVGQAGAFNLAGVPVNNFGETTCASQTLNVLDRATAIFCSGGTTSTFTFPVHTTSGFGANFPMVICNNNSGAMTLTPTTDTLDTASLFPNWCSHLYNNNSGNWQSYQHPQFGAFPNCTDSGGNHLNFTTATGVFSCGTSSSGGGGSSGLKRFEEISAYTISGGTVAAVGFPTTSIAGGCTSGSNVAATATEGDIDKCPTSTTLNNDAGWRGLLDLTSAGNPIYNARIGFDDGAGGVTSARAAFGMLICVGCNDVILLSSADTTPNTGAWFRCSSSVPDTNWQALTYNGTTSHVIDTGVTCNTSAHTWTIVYTTGVSIAFSIDGVLKATMSTAGDMPTGGVEMEAFVRTLTTAVRNNNYQYQSVQGDH